MSMLANNYFTPRVEYRLAGTIGTLSALTGLAILVRHHYKQKESFSLYNCGTWLNKRTLIRGNLSCFCILQSLYYSSLYYYIYVPPAATFYSCHLLALWNLYVGFAVLCTLWMEEVTLSIKAKSYATVISMVYLIVLSGFTFAFVIACEIYGIEHILRGELYRMYVLASASMLFLACAGFLGNSIRLQCYFHSHIPNQDVSRKLNVVILISSCSLLIRVGLTTCLYLDAAGYIDWVHSMDAILWFCLTQWIPDFGLFSVMHYLTKAPPRTSGPRRETDRFRSDTDLGLMSYRVD